MTLLDVAELTALNWDTVKDIVKRRLRRDYGRINLKGVRYVSIDEIYVGKRRGYYTLVMDIESGRILWVSQGRGKASLRGFWPRLRRSRVRIRAVAMDMSGAYWAAVVEALVGVAVVFDKFHIIQLMNQRLDDLRRELVREAEGSMKLVIKGTRYLLPKLSDSCGRNVHLRIKEAFVLTLLVEWWTERRNCLVTTLFSALNAATWTRKAVLVHTPSVAMADRWVCY